MVFAGQDAWRKHPLIYGCWKNPLPGLKTAVGIFTAYVLAESFYKYVTAVPSNENSHKPSIKFKAETFGDKMPEALIKQSHH